MMASRVTLLLLVTGLFAGMWSGDRAGERSANERLLARKAASSEVVLQSGGRPNQTIARAVTRHRDERSLSSIPLPNGITVGTYLIVDGRGRTEARVVTSAEAIPSEEVTSGEVTGHAAADQYMVRVGRDRWHFIRLEESSDSVARRRTSSLSQTGSARAASLR